MTSCTELDCGPIPYEAKTVCDGNVKEGVVEVGSSGEYYMTSGRWEFADGETIYMSSTSYSGFQAAARSCRSYSDGEWLNTRSLETCETTGTFCDDDTRTECMDWDGDGSPDDLVTSNDLNENNGCSGGECVSTTVTEGDTENCFVDVSYDDPSCTPKPCDEDGDGYDKANARCGGDDCNDFDADVHPGAAEICDGADNDCDSNTDESWEACPGVSVCTFDAGDGYACRCPDNDGDGYDSASCSDDDAKPDTDCNDFDADIHPNAAEVCDGKNNDCNDGVDEPSEVCREGEACTSTTTPFGTYYSCSCQDSDGDGFDDEACGGLDCNDGNADINPDATEICDSHDNDCDGERNEGGVCEDICTDSDGDGYTGPNCGDNDCDDGDADEHPGQTWVKDADGDGYWADDPGEKTQCQEPSPAGDWYVKP